MRWKFLLIATLAFFTILPVSKSIAASGFVTDDTPLWTTTDTNTATSATTSSMTLDSISLDASASSTSQATSTPGFQSARHGYDELDRLKWTQYEDGTVISYLYDKVGNRTAKSTDAGTLASFTITATASGYGSIIPSGTITVASGNGQTFFIEPGAAPMPGSLLSLLLDNVAVNLGTLPSIQGANGLRYYYTLANVTSPHTLTANFTSPPASLCTNYPARLAGTAPVNHLSLQSAYNAAASNDTIQGNIFDHYESLNLDRNVSVTLDGGYSCDYSLNTGNLTIKGAMIIANGSVIVSGNIILATP